MIQSAVAGLAAGGVYAVIAACLTLMAHLIRVVNFAQVAIAMAGVFTATTLAGRGVPLALAVLLGIALAAAISAAVGLIIAIWLPEESTSRRSAVTVATLLALISLSFIVFGNKPLPFRAILAGPAFTIGGVVVSQVTLVLVGFAIAVAVLATLVLTRTDLGIRLRALAQRPTTAELIGIPSRRLSVGVWVATSVLTTLVIALIAPSQSNDAMSLSMLVVPAAAAALVGAFRRLGLAVVGGLALGLLEGALASIEGALLLRYFLPFLMIVALLLWRQRKEVWDAER